LCLFVTQSKNILYLLHIQKMAILQSLTTFLLLFAYFLSCVYTGYYSDPVPAALKAEGAAGGGGPAIAPPPGPRFHKFEISLHGEYEAKKPLSGYPVTNSGVLAFCRLTKHTLSLPILYQNNFL
jgi:hypothetical protein